MSLAVQSSKLRSIFVLTTLLFGCEEEAKKEPPAPKPSASLVATVAPPPAPIAQPPKLRDDCPEGSS